MAVDQTFALATHCMATLAFKAPGGVSATFIGRDCNVNPVVIRRTLAKLARAGLVVSRTGAKGGYRLTRPAEAVTLLDIYNAIHARSPFVRRHGFPDAQCVAARSLIDVLENVYEDADRALEQVLSAVSLADVLRAADQKTCAPRAAAS